MITTSQRLFCHLLLAAVAVWTPSVASAQWEVKPFRGTPALWRDGQPVTPMIFWQSYPLRYEVEAFSKEGIDLFSFFWSGQNIDHFQIDLPQYATAVFLLEPWPHSLFTPA